MGWIVRAVLIVAGIIASWFIAEDALSFPVFQMSIALLLIVAAVAAMALWRRR